jgi:hypothetical protein
VAIVIIILVTLSLILLSFESVRKLGAGLLTGVGIGGIIIGFAAQKSLGNLLAGFQIAFTQPIRIDDVLVVEGEWGRVEDITLTYVVLNIWDQRRLILPINYFIEKPFQNWTRTTAEFWALFFYMWTIEIKDCRQKLVNYKDVSFYIKRLIAFHGRDVRLDDKVDHLQLSAQLQTITELIKANKTQEANRSIGSFEKQITQFFSIMSSSKNAELRDLSSFYFKPPYGTELIYPKYEQVNK